MVSMIDIAIEAVGLLMAGIKKAMEDEPEINTSREEAAIDGLKGELQGYREKLAALEAMRAETE